MLATAAAVEEDVAMDDGWRMAARDGRTAHELAIGNNSQWGEVGVSQISIFVTQIEPRLDVGVVCDPPSAIWCQS